MTKSPHKLTLRKETLRALNTIDLTRVVGGASDTAQLAGGQTADPVCPRQSDIIVRAK